MLMDIQFIFINKVFGSVFNMVKKKIGLISIKNKVRPVGDRHVLIILHAISMIYMSFDYGDIYIYELMDLVILLVTMTALIIRGHN